VGKAEVAKIDISEIKRTAEQQARTRANADMWSVDIAIFMLGVLFIIVILLYQGVGTEIAVPIAIFGLCMGWFVGWRQGRRLYKIYYDEELIRSRVKLEELEEKTIEESAEEMVRKALMKRWKSE